MKNKISLIEYKEICTKLHSGKYDYSLVDLSNDKIEIICNIHGKFLQNKYSHKLGMGCWKCSVEFRSKLQSLGKEEFIKKSIEIHGNIYNYDMVNYKNNNTKVKILCRKHGEYSQIPSSHLSGNGCPKCGAESMVQKQSHNTERFIEKATKIHSNKYDYSKVDYINNNSKVIIICRKHGDFFQFANNHLKGYDCPKCKGKLKTTDDFIHNSNLIHNFKYDYSKTKYINSEKKVEIFCKKHGSFLQNPNNHLNGSGCPKCYVKNIKSNTKDFIEKSMKLHLDRYDYSLVDYKNAKTNVLIICRKHGEFRQQPTHHLSGKGCPICKSSKGENKIFNILKLKNIKFEHHYVFNNFKLEFDFYLPEHNICIEYDGIQHFKPVNHFGGEVAFVDQVRRDKEKDEYCLYNNIHLLRIPYTEQNIELFLNNNFLNC
jgi:Zn finger protein HypA/HybF involved in hydrogenase expression